MKNLFTVLAIALFTISVSGQETKPEAKAPLEKGASAKKCSSAKKCAAEEKSTFTTEEIEKCSKTNKSCCAKKA